MRRYVIGVNLNIQEFKQFIKEHIHALEPSGKENPLKVQKRFQLTSREYLSFAENELNNSSDVSRINCVSHLKRALDCQLDTYFHTFNLYELFNKRAIKVKTKLEFIGALGFLNSRSLVRLNNIRNGMEHDYVVPDIADIEVYFDLITALVQLLEHGAFEAAGCDFGIYSDTSCSDFNELIIKYDQHNTSIHVQIKAGEEENNITFTTSAETNIEDFAYMFKVLRMLNLLWDCQWGHEFVLRELEIT